MPTAPVARLYLHPADYFSVCVRVRVPPAPHSPMHPPHVCVRLSLPRSPVRALLPLLHDAAVIQS